LGVVAGARSLNDLFIIQVAVKEAGHGCNLVRITELKGVV